MATSKRIRIWRIILWAAMGAAIGALSGRWVIALPIGVVFAFARYIGELSRPKPKSTSLPSLDPKMAEHYAASGLSDEEIKLFRKTMADLAEQIRTIEALTKEVPKLRALTLNTDLVDLLHAYFEALVQAPQRLTDAGTFVYQQVPNLLDLMQKYAQITHHEVKTADTYETLDKAFSTMTSMAGNIKSDYQAFIKDDLDDLDSDVRLAKKHLDPDKAHETE
ncbi:5-bromo-4-chloroindolyl phosphate hydrolysis family protein [Lacticaseibacillus paracasei]|uniref:5-bromo-4-chloroindolyl phosphate hydrolysis protein n=2 Tax=Lacticaseibacillus paracasei subsp. paracasei TaxID=47714 RepID=A0A829HA39_LACPA|nr:5-bromo-4-chloroindolyl phosphate hydrolysis family protein [Lacticaseibacillus paracasei]EKQ22194.1 5-bromo-4-chloroindolyl phosphate hydrolysis protein [Lacticaseibacillus casei UW4]EPC31049.1 5-bromo-4-chloroindolyl phosphate hydrolysis protein [Lacticaseibacillus paracasei subsp. paracasei Lpp22]EPC75434.1 5-bromo-4-chloroindolyl phosphate hydrolysis protein [Lacticaseibacillus paracasei subsp. paracasei Lpp41]OJF75060.1 MFS transporter [Lacticaseibacillus casei]ATG98693.1 MFS transport